MTAFTNKQHHDCRRYVIFALIVFSITSMMMASITNNYKNDINNNSLLAFAIKKGKDNSPSSPSGSSTTSSTDHVKTIKKPTDTATTTTDHVIKGKGKTLGSTDTTTTLVGNTHTSGGSGVNGKSGAPGGSGGQGGAGGKPSKSTTTTSSKHPKCNKNEMLLNGICVPIDKCKKGTHFVITLGCVKNHLTRHEAFLLGCKMGVNDGPDQENYVGTGGFKGHSAAFTRGYNVGFGTGDTAFRPGGPCAK